MHFGDTRPAFAGHGAVLLEVESREFFAHLKELLDEEAPELGSGLLAFAAVELKPATMVRARKELARTAVIAQNLDRVELRSHDSGLRRIGDAFRSLQTLASDLTSVLATGAAPKAEAARATVVANQACVANEPDVKPVAKPNRPSLDSDRLAVRWDGKEVTLDGGKHRRFRLLQLLLERPGVAISHAVLCGPGNPWKHNASGRISDAAIKSIVRELRRDLSPLGELPFVIQTQSIGGEPRPILRLR